MKMMFCWPSIEKRNILGERENECSHTELWVYVNIYILILLQVFMKTPVSDRTSLVSAPNLDY